MHRTESRRSGVVTQRLILLVALASLLLGGCTDDLIEALLGAAAPSVNPSEQGLTIAQFDQDARRVALPNDVVLLALNQELAAMGKSQLTGTARNMPIRIPFSGPIDYPFTATDGSFDAGAAAAWATHVFVIDTTPGPTQPALPYYAGGNFKAVYQDSNNDLVLVPSSTQFAANTTYAVVVTTGVTDLNGNPVYPSIPMTMVRQTSALVDGSGHSTSSLLTDSEAQQLETLRQGLAPLFTVLSGSGIQRSDVALMFTFKTETTDSTATTAGLISTVEGSGALNGASTNLQWITSALGVSDSPASAGDFKSAFAGVPVNAIQAIYHGFYACSSFMSSDGSGDYIMTGTPGNVCPNSDPIVGSGNIDFWLAKPIAALTGIAVFQHGITRDSTDFIAVANTLASIGVATIAINLWDHGDRIYSIAGSEVPFVRPDDPSKTVGYLLQSRFDVTYLASIANNNTELQNAAILGSAPGALFYVGQSLGSIVGAGVALNSVQSFDAVLLNVPGGDLVDIVLEGAIGSQELIPEVAATVGQAVGSTDLNATLLGIELATRHALFAGLSDPLALYNPGSPPSTATLVQQMTGDEVIPNSDTELLSRVMALTTYSDGAGTKSTSRSRWIYNPSNYTPANAGHGFLLDALTTATTKGQTQMATWLATGNILDPSVP